MPHLKLAVFSLFFATLAIANAPQAYAKSRLFTYECNQEKGQLELLTFEKHNHEINEVHNAEKGIYSVWQNDRSPVKRSLTQTCEIDGHEIKITLGYHPYYRSAYGSWCADLHEHVTFIDAWLDGEKIIEKLRFHPGCIDFVGSFGQTEFLNLYIKPITNDKKLKGAMIQLEDGIQDRAYTVNLNKRKGAGSDLDRPLNNRDVHGNEAADKFKYFEPQPSEE